MAPRHAGVHFVAGVAALREQDYRPALDHLQAATRLNADRPDYAAQSAAALSAVFLGAEALSEARRAMALGGLDAMSLDTVGVVFTQNNAHAEALQAFAGAAAAMPTVASYRFNLATSLTFNGRLDEAEQEYEACLAHDPGHWKAHLALSQHRRQTEQRNHLDRLRRLRAEHEADPVAVLYLDLALAKELEDLGQYADAFGHLVSGKAAGGRLERYQPERDVALFDALHAAFSDVGAVSSGDPSAQPIFVIGMPRSGTTLVDRILSSHPAVRSAGELQNFGVALKRLSGSRTQALLDSDTIQRALGVDPQELGRVYLESTRPGTDGTPHFVDKLPHNFLYAGFIARALPNARIVCLRRDPVDTCLSNFRQLFAAGNPYYGYSYDVMDTGRYYLQFDRLMRHWQQVLPGRILEVDYEQLVNDQEGQTRRLLEFCGLPWDDACLRFQDNAAPVATASVVQVREGLHARSSGRWKRYADQLTEVRALLREGGLPVG
ncbi:hypothetical protein GCM10028795_20120 [Lysobacter olei]